AERMADGTPPTQDRVEGYFKELNNWGRWGHDDQRGTANGQLGHARGNEREAPAAPQGSRTQGLAGGRALGPGDALSHGDAQGDRRRRPVPATPSTCDRREEPCRSRGCPPGNHKTAG